MDCVGSGHNDDSVSI